ncbi:HNH endonuclease signature motif containing protein, partial [Pseudomonas aeruginosa]
LGLKKSPEFSKKIRQDWGSATRFKKGQKPHTWLPVGSTRISADGYLQRKISDTGYPPRDWKGIHILLWEEHFGPIPTGHCVCFKDNNKQNVVIDNLELITRAERMRRNSIHRYPPELKSAIRV